MKKFSIALALSCALASTTGAIPESDTAQWWGGWKKAHRASATLNICQYVQDISGGNPQAALWFLSTGGKYGFSKRMANPEEVQNLTAAIRNVAQAIEDGTVNLHVPVSWEDEFSARKQNYVWGLILKEQKEIKRNAIEDLFRDVPSELDYFRKAKDKSKENTLKWEAERIKEEEEEHAESWDTSDKGMEVFIRRQDELNEAYRVGLTEFYRVLEKHKEEEREEKQEREEVQGLRREIREEKREKREEEVSTERGRELEDYVSWRTLALKRCRLKRELEQKELIWGEELEEEWLRELLDKQKEQDPEDKLSLTSTIERLEDRVKWERISEQSDREMQQKLDEISHRTQNLMVGYGTPSS